MHINFLYYFLVFSVGSAMGSFIMASAMRLKDDESIMTPSRCRFCEKNLNPLELIPVFSWILQRGKCACQKFNLSLNYLLAEVFLGLIYVILFSRYPFPESLFLLAFATGLTFCFLTDYIHQLLHLPTMIFIGALGIFYDYYLHGPAVSFSVLGLLVGFLILFSINIVFKKLRRKDGFGDGDKYLLGAIGTWVGAYKVVILLFLASWIGLLFAIPLLLKKRADLSSALPFGVYLTLAVPLVYFLKI
jgi:leader peptidase (prepilin peptidase) / N-methyltransferase